MFMKIPHTLNCLEGMLRELMQQRWQVLAVYVRYFADKIDLFFKANSIIYVNLFFMSLFWLVFIFSGLFSWVFYFVLCVLVFVSVFSKLHLYQANYLTFIPPWSHPETYGFQMISEGIKSIILVLFCKQLGSGASPQSRLYFQGF